MYILAHNHYDESITVLSETDNKSAINALNVMKRMRWAKVKRHGRKGHRWYEVSMRNRSEWRRGYAEVDGVKARIK